MHGSEMLRKYLHVSAEGGVGAEKDLALLVGTVVHAGEFGRLAGGGATAGVCLQQAGAGSRPGREPTVTKTNVAK